MKPQNRYIALQFLQLVLVFAGIYSAYFVSILANNQTYDWFVILSLLLLVSIIVWLLTYGINKQIDRIKIEEVRKEYEFEEKIDGIWIEKFEMSESDNTGYGLIEVDYDSISKAVNLRGTVYDSEGRIFANWTSKSVYTDRITKSIFYIYEGEYQDKRLQGNRVVLL